MRPAQTSSRLHVCGGAAICALLTLPATTIHGQRAPEPEAAIKGDPNASSGRRAPGRPVTVVTDECASDSLPSCRMTQPLPSRLSPGLLAKVNDLLPLSSASRTGLIGRVCPCGSNCDLKSLWTEKPVASYEYVPIGINNAALSFLRERAQGPPLGFKIRWSLSIADGADVLESRELLAYSATRPVQFPGVCK